MRTVVHALDPWRFWSSRSMRGVGPGRAAGSKALTPLIKMGSKLSAEEYESKVRAPNYCVLLCGGRELRLVSVARRCVRGPGQVVGTVVKMFAQTDRAMRLSLLENLSNFIDHMAPKLITQSVFPQVVRGSACPGPFHELALAADTVGVVCLLASHR